MTHFETGIHPQSEEFATNKAAADALTAKLQTRMAQAIGGGGAERLRERHHARGKLLVRDRIDRVIDPGTAFLRAICRWRLGGNTGAT